MSIELAIELSKTERIRNAKMKLFRNAKINLFKNAKMKLFRNPKINLFRNAKMKLIRNSNTKLFRTQKRGWIHFCSILLFAPKSRIKHRLHYRHRQTQRQFTNCWSWISLARGKADTWVLIQIVRFRTSNKWSIEIEYPLAAWATAMWRGGGAAAVPVLQVLKKCQASCIKIANTELRF